MMFRGDGDESARGTLLGSETGDDWRPLPTAPLPVENASAAAAPPPPTVTLSPGQCAVVWVTARTTSATTCISFVKAKLTSTRAAGGNAWKGTLTTPAFPVWTSDVAADRREGTLDLPDHLPPMSHCLGLWRNMSGAESHFDRLAYSNRELTRHLALYRPDQVVAFLEDRLAREDDLPMKLLLASEAAVRGSRKAKEHFLIWRTSTDHQTVLSTLDALASMGRRAESVPSPEWLADELIDALRDEREVYTPAEGYQPEMRDTVWRVAERAHVAIALDVMKCKKAVPALIEAARRTPAHSLHAYSALANIGGPEAKRFLLQILEEQAAEARARLADGNQGFKCPPQSLATALARLDVRAAVPTLLEFLSGWDVIEALQEMGDRRAIPHLRKLVADRGRFTWNGVPLWPANEALHLGEARVALAALEDGDALPRYAALLADMSAGEYARGDAAQLLGRTKDPRAVEHLLEAVKNDPLGSVVNQAIWALGSIEHPSAVDALVDCFDAEFERKTDWKVARNPEHFRANVAWTLRDLTGQSLGARKVVWERWWEKSRDSFIFPER